MKPGELIDRLGRWAGDSALRGAIAWFVIVASLPLWMFGGREE